MKEMEDGWVVFVQGGNMTERERMISGKLYNPYMISDNPWAEIRAACKNLMNLIFGVTKVRWMN